MSAGEFAFRIGRGIGKHPLAGRLFCLTERLLPLTRIARNDDLLAFHHPRPIADPHVLIVPTKPVASLTASGINDEQRAMLISKMVELGREVTTQLSASEHWQLVINGGTRQDIGQMHAHLMHADVYRREGTLLQEPKIGLDVWRQIFTVIHEADRIPDCGYSLEIRWGTDQPAIAKVTQSVPT